MKSDLKTSRLYFLAILLTLAITMAVFVLMAAIGHTAYLLFDVVLFTQTQFLDCAKTIALVMFATLWAPLAAIGVGAYLQERR